MEKIKNSILPVDKSFGLATFQEVILLSLYKHLVRWTENNLDIVQDYHLAKLFDSPIPEYLTAFGLTKHLPNSTLGLNTQWSTKLALILTCIGILTQCFSLQNGQEYLVVCKLASTL